MTNITSSDLIWATATYNGRTIACFSDTGYTSMADVIRAVRSALGALAGIVELSVRNASKGWRSRRTVFVEPVKPGVQLTLF